MAQKKKMLYLMHIDWNWIKQRPQYIEEALEKEFEITVICPRNYRLKKYNDKKNVFVFYPIPFIRRYPKIWKIDLYRKKAMVCRYIKRLNPDCIFVTSPEYAECIPKWFKKTVIYDCMDDMLAFNKEKHLVERVSVQEREMVRKSDIVLATSKRLQEILNKRYPDSSHKFYLVRNGYDGKIVDIKPHISHEHYVFCYFGTISHWFNFDFILKSLDEFKDIQYLLIGPVEGGTTIPQHDRIRYMPPVEHDRLSVVTEIADAFIMPFQINELILPVDPVKLYEYINLGKNILCVEYPEVERFSSFVFFYTDYELYKKQIQVMKEAGERKYSDRERREFLSKNDWEQRKNTIVSLLKEDVLS